MKNIFNSESKWPVGFRERAKRQLAPNSESFPRNASLRARLRNFARLIKRALLRISQLRALHDDRRWTGHAFRDFIGPDGKREAMFSSLAMHRRVLLSQLKDWRADKAGGRVLAESLLNICTQIDDGSVWHKDLKLRSYVDVSIQVKALRIFVDELSTVSGLRVDLPETHGVAPRTFSEFTRRSAGPRRYPP
jgi:hypothetical protein